MVGCPLAVAAVLSCTVQVDRWIAPHLAVRTLFGCCRWTCQVTQPVQRTPLWPASWLPASVKSRGSKSVEVQRVWEVYEERLQFMSRQDALQLDESLDAGDVSRAWLVWSGAAETALVDAFRFSGGPLPGKGLVLGRGCALFRVVRLGGHRVLKVRGNAADALDAADSLWSLSFQVGGAHCPMGQGSCSWAFVSCDSVWIRVWALVHFIMLLLMFIVVSVISFMLSWFTVVMRRLGSAGIGFERTLWCIPVGGFVQIWFTQLHFFSASPI